ncbi:NifB/NifX family molybdenum-iron cluster-binding protein [Minisyncoccus archaeiphilus]|uniref:NifB/NifX family molybdenum-iron cluster-binding protein n=1 Tax=Minisyncoccus archaeiphilus TaxID=3238481 RepID=UPI00399CEA69
MIGLFKINYSSVNKNLNNMKIAISTVGESLDSEISDVFGRSPYIIIVESESGEIKNTEIIKNENDGQQSGVGMVVAKLVAGKGASVVIAKNVGPRALDVLQQFDIKIFDASGKASQALQDLINKKVI